MRTERVENVHARLAKVARDLLLRGDSGNGGVSLCFFQAFVVGKEKRLLSDQRSAQGSAKIVLYQKFSAGHLVEAMRIHQSITQVLISRAVIQRRAPFSHDVDLAATCSSQFR